VVNEVPCGFGRMARVRGGDHLSPPAPQIAATQRPPGPPARRPFLCRSPTRRDRNQASRALVQSISPIAGMRSAGSRWMEARMNDGPESVDLDGRLWPIAPRPGGSAAMERPRDRKTGTFTGSRTRMKRGSPSSRLRGRCASGRRGFPPIRRREAADSETEVLMCPRLARRSPIGPRLIGRSRLKRVLPGAGASEVSRTFRSAAALYWRGVRGGAADGKKSRICAGSARLCWTRRDGFAKRAALSPDGE